ncbi:hypothetical protein C0991_008326 [Blastosporella zonata]|nr:hypothetical protein C0991_008326 [Blastosporella zonata]
MQAKKTPERPQATISSFFQLSQRSSSGKRASSPIHLDLTADEEPPTKRLKKSDTSYTSRQPTTPRGGVAEQWRFTPASPDKPETNAAPSQRTEAQIIAAKGRHEAFKKKLLLENNPFIRKPMQSHPERASSPIDEQEADSGDESDHAFKELSSLFSNKGKGKGKAVSTAPRKSKQPVAIGPSGEPYTPLEQQVLQFKSENPETLLVFEVGYKYRFFGDDAKVAAKELGMVAFEQRNFLVASIPTHRLDVHLKTYVNELDSADDQERYNPPPLMCLVDQAKKGSTGNVSFGMITICPSTGDVVWDDFEDTLMRIELETRLVHTRPAELLLPRNDLSHPTTKMLEHFTGNSSAGDRVRTEHFKDTLSYTNAFDLVSTFYTDKTQAAVASESFTSGRLMAEVANLPKRVVVVLAHAIKHLSAFSIADAFLETKFFSKFTTKTHMLLAANTLTNLEIYRNETDFTTTGSLLWLLDKTKTKFGARLLRNWIGRPLVDKRVLHDRVEAVEEIVKSSSEKLVTLRQILKRCPDLAKGLCRIQYGQGNVGFESNLLNEIIFSLPKLKQSMKELLGAVHLQQAAKGKKDAMWTDPDRYPDISDADMAIQFVDVELEDQLKAIRKLLRTPSLQWATNGKDEFLVEHRNSDNRPIPDHWILHSKYGSSYDKAREVTTNSPSNYRTKVFSRHQPPIVREKLEERLQYQETLQAAANKAFSSFLEDIALNHHSILRDAVNKLATCDCLLSLAQVALQQNYVRPTFTDDDTLEIVDGRHPMVEVLRPDPFVPNTIVMGGGKPRSKIITGPNMGGKSSCVRMVALIAIMAQIGSYVPATSVKMGLVDSVLTRMGASDDLAKGRSTFMVEMSETSEILHSATKNSLVILDELGRGTSTFDGMAIADAVMQQLLETTMSKTLFITHYPLVASNLESQYFLDVENLHMGFEEDTRINGIREITFLYRLTPGMASGSFGIECGRLAGLPESLLTVATQSSAKLELDIKDRTRRNRILKSVKLLADCLSDKGMASAAKTEELRAMTRSIFDSTEL